MRSRRRAGLAQSRSAASGPVRASHRAHRSAYRSRRSNRSVNSPTCAARHRSGHLLLARVRRAKRMFCRIVPSKRNCPAAPRRAAAGVAVELDSREGRVLRCGPRLEWEHGRMQPDRSWSTCRTRAAHEGCHPFPGPASKLTFRSTSSPSPYAKETSSNESVPRTTSRRRCRSGSSPSGSWRGSPPFRSSRRTPRSAACDLLHLDDRSDQKCELRVNATKSPTVIWPRMIIARRLP